MRLHGQDRTKKTSFANHYAKKHFRSRYKQSTGDYLEMSKYLVLFGIALFCINQVVVAQKEPVARLLVSKIIHNKILVQNMDVVVQYTLYNMGEAAALNIELKDDSFQNQFEVVSGQLNFKLDRLGPSQNVTHTVVIRPVIYGEFNFSSAIVSYRVNENAAEEQRVISSAPGAGYISNFREYDKKFSPHFLDWSAFGIMSVPLVAIPFALFYASKKKYDAILKQKKEKVAKD